MIESLESLESRRLLSGVTTSVTAGILTVTGGPNTNTINVNETGGSVSVEDDAVNIGTFPGITGIVIQGGAKDDRVFFKGNSVGAKVFAGSGNDQLTVSDTGSGASRVDGEAGDDIVTVLAAHNTEVNGGGGSDDIEIAASVGSGHTIVHGLGGGDRITTRAGTNDLWGDGGNDQLFIDASFTVNGGTNILHDDFEIIQL